MRIHSYTCMHECTCSKVFGGNCTRICALGAIRITETEKLTCTL